VTAAGDAAAFDELRPPLGGIGYRVVLDLDAADADLMDDVARREGLQPTQVLLEALRAYSRNRSAQLLAINRLGMNLRRVA